MVDRDAVLRTALDALAPVLGPVRLTGVTQLRGSDRSLVLRAGLRDGAGTEHRVVLKAPLTAADGAVREAAALRLLTERGVPGAVRLLADAAEPPVLVLADLGSGCSLADHLLGDDPGRAEAALGAWATALGRVQARTSGLREAFAAGLAALSPLGSPAVDASADTLAAAAGTLERTLPRLGLVAPAGALAELRGIAADLDVTAPGSPGSLTPGDTCPDNVVETSSGPVLLDFEGAEYRHVAWEAAYLLVPWPSCWCSWLLPERVASRTLERWKEAVAPALPAVTEPAFDDDLLRAAVGWVFVSTAWFLPAALDGDPRPDDPARWAIVPTRWALLQHRLGWAARRPTALLPALRELAGEMWHATRREWGEHPLELAAAFR